MTDALRKAAQKALRLMELNRMWPEVTTELRAALAAQAEQDTAATIVGHSVARGGWCVYEPDIGGEYTCLRGPFATQEEAISAQHQQATAQAEPVAQPEPKPLRRGTTGTCSRSICICDRDGLGDQCIWLRPSEPMIDGYPLMSGLPPPAQAKQATAADALRRDNDNLRTVMIAAAEEIHAHWDAHCDAEGYGPANLMHRLEEGIPAEYGYTAGAFAALKATQADEIAAAVAFERERCAALCEMWNTSPGSSLAKEIRGGAEAGKPQAEPVADELGWLIEMRPSENLLWWDGGFDVSDDYPSKRLFARMVNDVNKAVRFSRREDAQCVLDAMLAVRPSPLFASARTLYSVQEHIWHSAAQAEPVAFDPSIGADRYQVVKGSFWWHIRIGDGTANVGKFHSKLAAEDVALKLLTAFRDGAFMQSKAAQPQQAAAQAEPVAWRYEDSRGNYRYRGYAPGFDREYAILKPVALYLAAQPQQVTANPPTPFDAVARAMDKASLLAGAVARSDTTLADERAADLRRHLVQYMYPDAQPQQATADPDDQEWDRNAERITQEVFGSGKGINPHATSVDDLFLDDDPDPPNPALEKAAESHARLIAPQDELQQAKARIAQLELEMRKIRPGLRAIFDRELWDSLD